MQINWFTVVAQLLNFVVLVWLMKRFLYQPILKAIDEREKKIAQEISDAKNKIEEATKEQVEFKKKNEDFDHHKKTLMAQASTEAEQEKQKLLVAAKNEAQEVREKLEDASKELQENLSEELFQKTHQEVFSITTKALSELASTNLEEQTINVFVTKIKTITEKEKKQFIKAFKSASSVVSIKSAFGLPEKGQKEIQTAISDILGEDIQYSFSTDPKMISGIELATNGFKLSWSFSAYLSSLGKRVSATKEEIAKTI